MMMYYVENILRLGDHDFDFFFNPTVVDKNSGEGYEAQGKCGINKC